MIACNHLEGADLDHQAAPLASLCPKRAFCRPYDALVASLQHKKVPQLLLVHLETLPRNHHLDAPTPKPAAFPGKPLDRIP
jgi:hypothetical protein